MLTYIQICSTSTQGDLPKIVSLFKVRLLVDVVSVFSSPPSKPTTLTLFLRSCTSVINDAEEQGLLHPYTKSRIFEGTVGSTGISIATIARAKFVVAFLPSPLLQQIANVCFIFKEVTKPPLSCPTT